MRVKKPDVTLVLPCYNEEAAIGRTAPELMEVFNADGLDIQLVLVDNGSGDRTGAIIDDLVESGYPVKKVAHETNQGYGGGILSGLKAGDAPIVGYLCADGQVSAKDALMAYHLLRGKEATTLAKVRRRFRRDSWRRKLASSIYNIMMQVLFGWLGAIDINGSPKLFSREIFDAMDLRSGDWFLDPEIIIKAKHLGLKILEVDVEGHMRRGGASNVKIRTCLEFLFNIFLYRFGGKIGRLKRDLHVHRERIRTERTGGREEGTKIGGRARTTGEEANILDRVLILDQKRFADPRGYVQKVLASSRCEGEPPGGEIYVTSANPKRRKGNHYHLEMGEWFSVIQGEGEMILCDPRNGEKKRIPLSASAPKTVYVPAGLAHAIENTGEVELICIAWAEKEHDPSDVYSFVID